MNDSDRGSGLNEQFSVKDVLLEVVLPKLDTIDRKLDTKAEAARVEELEKRLAHVEREGSPEAQQALQALAALQVEVAGLKAWRNRLAGATTVLAALVVPIAIDVIAKHGVP